MGAKRAGWFHRKIAEDPNEELKADLFQTEPGAAGVFLSLFESECGAEGAASGDYDVHRGEIFRADDHAAGHDEHASDAGQGIGGGYFPDRAAVLGELAG